jgi:hypothetical protein
MLRGPHRKYGMRAIKVQGRETSAGTQEITAQEPGPELQHGAISRGPMPIAPVGPMATLNSHQGDPPLPKDIQSSGTPMRATKGSGSGGIPPPNRRISLLQGPGIDRHNELSLRSKAILHDLLEGVNLCGILQIREP